MKKMDKNRKLILWVSIAFTIVGIINTILYAVLTNLGLARVRDIGYVFAFGFMATVWVPMLLNLLFKTKFDLVLLISYNVFMYLSIALGSMWFGYSLIPGYDKFVHFFSGVLFALLGYNLFKNSKLNKVSLFWIFMISFSVSMMCGAVWEIYEFTSDFLLGNNSQGTANLVGQKAIMDTMLDIVCDCGGAILGSIGAVLLEKFGKLEKIDKNVEFDNQEEVAVETE